MVPSVVRRAEEQRAVDGLLAAARTRPAALLVGGEAGMGKTTLWSAALTRATASGFRVLQARARQPETVPAFTTVGDLLADVEPALAAGIPSLQKTALDRVLLGADHDGSVTDQRLVAAAFLSIVEALSADSPTLIAIDDVQWLDSSSRGVLAYALRRLRGPLGVLFTERDGHDRVPADSWLQLATFDEVGKVRVAPLGIGGLHSLLEQELGRSFPRPTLTRIANVSGGNPLYALELARAIGADPGAAEHVLPRTLAELVRLRIARLDEAALGMLLAAACVPSPTVDLLAGATGRTVEQVAALLEEPEAAGIVVLDGNRLGFTHPVLAHGVYLNAAPAQRQLCHRAWSEVATEPESRARHLALAATSSDEATLAALDEAAATVRARGAPAAAAELVDLAIGLGGDNPLRRYISAEHHLRSGDPARAQAVLKPGIAQMPPGPMRALMMFGYSVIVMHTEGYTESAEVLHDAIADATDAPPVLVQVWMMLAFTQINDGVYAPALEHARNALSAAEGTSDPALISQALAVWAFVGFNCGLGYDEAALQRALELEDRDGDVPVPFRASAIHALIMGWTGRLDESATELQDLGHRLVERGGEIEMLFVSYNSALVAVWQGRYADAAQFAEDTFRRTHEIGGDAMRAIGLSVRGWVAAHTGDEARARTDLGATLEAARRTGSTAWWYEVAVMGLGRLEISAGRYAEALEVFAPLLAAADQAAGTEITRMEYLPDVVESLIVTGRLAEAESVIDRLDRSGHERDRAWTLAAAARCRAMLLAAAGDVEGALAVVDRATTELARLPMPLEHARTQLLSGHLHRRRRHKHLAAAALQDALRITEEIGSPLWTARVCAELDRLSVSRDRDHALTPNERRVAELAADGLSTREIAATLFISAKTVEAHLSRVYRKLGIRSRAELGRRLADLAPHGDAAPS